MSNTEKKNKASLSKSDIDFYKMSGVFAIACIFVVITLRMSNTITLRHSTGANLTYNFYSLCHNPFFIALAAIIGLGSVAWYVYSRAKKIDESSKVFSSTDCLALVIYLAVFCASFGIEINSTRHMFFIIFTIAVSVIYFISKIFHIDFFFYTVMNSIFVLTLYMFATRTFALALAVKALMVIAAAVICYLVSTKYNGSQKSKKSKSYLFFPVYISLVLWAVGMFWKAFTMGTPLFLQTNAMIVIMLVQYLIVGIVYTIRLIRE